MLYIDGGAEGYQFQLEVGFAKRMPMTGVGIQQGLQSSSAFYVGDLPFTELLVIAQECELFVAKLCEKYARSLPPDPNNRRRG